MCIQVKQILLFHRHKHTHSEQDNYKVTLKNIINSQLTTKQAKGSRLEDVNTS